MKKLKLLLSLLVMFTSLGFVTVKAEDTTTEAITAEFSLDDDYQEVTVYDIDGEPITISVTKTTPMTRAVSNGSYVISSNNIIYNMSFTIDVVSQKITKAYDGTASVLGGTVIDDKIIRNSSVNVSYKVNYKLWNTTGTKILSAVINNGNLDIIYS